MTGSIKVKTFKKEDFDTEVNISYFLNMITIENFIYIL